MTRKSLVDHFTEGVVLVTEFRNVREFTGRRSSQGKVDQQ